MSLLFSEQAIGRVRLKNRIVATAHATALVDRGVPTEDDLAYWSERAAGGAGLLIVGGTLAHESGLLHLDCGKARERLGWRPVWNATTTFERTVAWYRRQHEQGAVDSRADLDRYVADARRAGLPWATERIAEAA